MKYVPFFWSTIWQFFLKKKESSPPKNAPQVMFENNGRSGYTKYSDGKRSIRFYTEAGGGDCIFYISIPTAEEWEKETGYPLANRQDILNFIGGEGLKKQARLSGAFYKMNESGIAFYQ